MYDCEVLRTAGKLLTTFHPQASTTTSYIKQFSKAMHEKYDGYMSQREQKKKDPVSSKCNVRIHSLFQRCNCSISLVLSNEIFCKLYRPSCFES